MQKRPEAKGGTMCIETVSQTDVEDSLVVPSPTQTSEVDRNCKDFLATFFSSLDGNQVRYCVLDSWEELPQNVSSDLDIAVHPKDDRKLKLVFQQLIAKGYTPVQGINYFAGAYSFRFFWVAGQAIDSLPVDIIFRHQRGALIAPSAQLLVSDRYRQGTFWKPAPEREFIYLLARRARKGTASARQQLRLRLLVEQLGRPTAEKLTGRFLSSKLKLSVTEACATGNLNSLLPQLKAHALRRNLLRRPFTLMVDLVLESMRLVRNWSQPPGLLVAVMGLDGVGKSTLIENLTQEVGPLFSRCKLFHWRPMLLWRRRVQRDTRQPHSLPPNRSWWSVARLFAHLLDYWTGYWLVVRPLVARCGLVVFDRYFDDIWIDPKRYRYGGPLWLPQILSLFRPKPDLVFVLDAPEEVVLSRKQEIAPEEIRRQRRLYREYQNRTSHSYILDSTASPKQLATESARTMLKFLSRRFKCRHGSRWLMQS